MNMVNTTYNSTVNMTIKLQQFEGETKLKVYKNISIMRKRILKNSDVKKFLVLKMLKVIVNFIMTY